MNKSDSGLTGTAATSGPATRGRRPGRSDARERILDAARERFLADGYQAVTMRSIAAAAEVDVALVSYYFQSKQGVFGAAMALPVNPLDVIDLVLTSPDDQLAAGLLTGFLRLWDDPASGAPLRSMALAAITEPALGRVVGELVTRELIPKIATRLDASGRTDGIERAGALATQMTGLILSRYLLRIDPIATMAAADVVALLTPVLSVALFGAT